jgi:dienelactone hydrolase
VTIEIAPRQLDLRVEPARSRIDQPLRLTVAGPAPGSLVTLSARTLDGAMVSWTSTATFTADGQGTVDPARDAPVEGTYAGVDGSGLWWSMRPEEARGHRFFSRRRPTPLSVTITASAPGLPTTSVTVERTFAGPGVVEHPIDGPGLIGSLFRPPEPPPCPGVLVLGGSDGGKLDHAAALLASHGYAALSLAYFGVEDRPPQLLRIEIEYFERALAWLAARPEVDGDALAVVGLSRGGELALLLASLLPQLKAVVAGSPSSVVQAGVASYTDFTQPAWIRNGEPLPYLSGGKLGPGAFLRSLPSFLLRRPMRQRKTFERLLRDPGRVRQAAIPVERIGGPVLLISGGDDQLWPSSRYCEQIVERLEAHHHPHPYRHLCYEHAGHFLCFPYGLPSLPPMTRLNPPGAPITIDFGGTAEANAAAARASWTEILRFLGEAIGGNAS